MAFHIVITFLFVSHLVDLHYKQISIIRISLISVTVIKKMVRNVVEPSPLY